MDDSGGIFECMSEAEKSKQPSSLSVLTTSSVHLQIYSQHQRKELGVGPQGYTLAIADSKWNLRPVPHWQRVRQQNDLRLPLIVQNVT